MNLPPYSVVLLSLKMLFMIKLEDFLEYPWENERIFVNSTGPRQQSMKLVKEKKYLKQIQISYKTVKVSLQSFLSILQS